MAELRYDDFAGSIGETYKVRAGDEILDLRLDRAQPHARAVREAGAFRLEFVGPVDPLLPQAIYAFEVGGESHEIFIVPIERNSAGTRYEAVFY
jgi:hypothetical protein